MQSPRRITARRNSDEFPESDNERFGKSVALSGNRIVVAKPIENAFDDRQGTAHVFRYDGANRVWEEEIGLHGTGATSEFGLSLDIDGDRIVVSARRAGNEFPPGAVYVFDFDGTDWIETRIPKPAQPGLNFGISVAVSGDIIVVGTQFRGEAYVYRYDGTAWSLEARLIASDPQDNDRFGELVDVADDRILVGARQADANAGAAYVFEYVEKPGQRAIVVNISGFCALTRLRTALHCMQRSEEVRRKVVIS